MEIFNRDYTGETEAEVISFIEQQISQMGSLPLEELINWNQWANYNEQLTVEEAKCRWRTLKKKIKNRTEQTLNGLLRSAKAANERKKSKHQRRMEKMNKKRLEKKKPKKNPDQTRPS
jgi:hypothetical protein